MTILIVEDSDTMRDVLRRQLEQLGTALVFAKSVSEARVAMGTKPPPDFIIYDINLEDLQGEASLRALAELKQCNPSAPVLIVTGTVDENLEQVALEIGVNAFRYKQQMKGQRDLLLAAHAAIDDAIARGIDANDALDAMLAMLDERLLADAQKTTNTT